MKSFVWIGAFVIVALAAVLFFKFAAPTSASTTGFVACVADSGAKFYGADWCSHCKDQKELLGEGYEQVYVECDDNGGQAEVCVTEGIQAYPTWKFADGSVQQGGLSLDKIAEKTGCTL